jgi:hypothetical protein
VLPDFDDVPRLECLSLFTWDDTAFVLSLYFNGYTAPQRPP